MNNRFIFNYLFSLFINLNLCLFFCELHKRPTSAILLYNPVLHNENENESWISNDAVVSQQQLNSEAKRLHALTARWQNSAEQFLILHISPEKQRKLNKAREQGSGRSLPLVSYNSFCLSTAEEMMNCSVSKISLCRAKTGGGSRGEGRARCIDKDALVRVVTKGWIMAHPWEVKLLCSTLFGDPH